MLTVRSVGPDLRTGRSTEADS